MKIKFNACSATILAAVSLAFAGCHSIDKDSMGNRGQLSPKDYKFVCEAARGGQMEVKMGQLASEKATNPEVRNFGQRMVRDHTKANQELTQLALQKGATLPPAPSKMEDHMMAHFQNLSGPAFDKAYMNDMLKDHRKDVALFQKESEHAQDTDLRNWVSATLPTLQDHLRLAEDLKMQ